MYTKQIGKLSSFKMSNDFDVTIIGSGPGGLAALSAMREDYSINMLSDVQLNRASRHIRESNKHSKAKRICVVDPNPDWLSQWERNFEALDISFLRSPTVAHCCYFDRNALLAYAISQGREDELLESGCSDIKSLKGTILPQVGLWKLPSTKLFIDFSRDLARQLKHKYIQGKVVDIGKDSLNSIFKITIGGNLEKVISSKSVILATGAVGRPIPIIPKHIKELSSTRIFQWQQLDQAISSLNQCAAKKSKVLVVGGGLTAVQAAHKVVKGSGAQVVLCSRRDLVERHFDIPVKWFDEREARFHQSQFYFEPEEERLKALKSTRGGGTVPPVYMKKTRALEIRGHITRKTGDVVSITEENDDSLMVTIKHTDSSEEKIEIDIIIVACGLKPDCMAHPLVQKIQEKWPIKMTGGFPIVSDELQWTENLHVVGGLSALSVGPDANNIMGISRAAETVANALNSKNWLRKKESNVLRNPFDVFLDETDISSDEEE